LAIPEQDAEIAINNVRLATHGDNKNFFGLNPDYQGVTGDALYRRMTEEYQKLGFAEADIPTWRFVAYPNVVQRTELTGASNDAEAQKTFAAVTEKEATNKEAIATKQVSINFRSGEFQLDENAKYIIDREFVDIAKAFGNARIRIEGNTDNVGNRASNVSLSKKRADAVKEYLVSQYSMDPNRFTVAGNGPDNPVADNSSETGRAQNRRTDFELIRE
jgi:NitT/TauT family transport system substrate-binding protein